MALHSNRVTQDQNFRIHSDGVKTNGSIAQKNRGGLGGRKAPNDDMSNDRKPSALRPSRKHNTINVIPIGEDLGVSKKYQIRVSGRKALSDLTNSVKPYAQQQQQQGVKKRGRGKQSITVAEDENLPYSIAEEGFHHDHEEDLGVSKKSQVRVSGRKALGDLTDSVKPSAEQQQGVKKRSQGKQSITVVAEDENFLYSIAEEGFLHDHEKCIQSQKEAMGLDLKYFWETMGFDEDVCFQSVSACKPQPRQSISKEESPIMISEMDEIPEPILDDGWYQNSPICGSPNSPICGLPSSPGLPFENSPPNCILAKTP